MRINLSGLLSLGGIRYIHGHGIHSPFVYNLIRHAFMPRRITGNGELYALLRETGIDAKTAQQINNVYHYCRFDSFIVVDDKDRPEIEKYGMIIVVARKGLVQDMAVLEDALRAGASVVVAHCRHSPADLRLWMRVIRAGQYLSIDKMRFFIVFGNQGLPGQHFKL